MDRNKIEEYETILNERKVGVTDFWFNKYDKESAKNWDKFYKRNGTNFFKDRHWINKEFEELPSNLNSEDKKVGLELGCGVGNYIYPVLKENPNLTMYACDFSPRAIQLVKEHPEYPEGRCHPFVCDITQQELTLNITENSVDYVSAVFVLSAIPPEKLYAALNNVQKTMKPGAILFFRDYAHYDAAELRFKSENKIRDRFYVRQDGTFSYYFEKEEFKNACEQVGLQVKELDYVYRHMHNAKKELDAERIFLQGKFIKK